MEVCGEWLKIKYKSLFNWFSVLGGDGRISGIFYRKIIDNTSIWEHTHIRLGQAVDKYFWGVFRSCVVFRNGAHVARFVLKRINFLIRGR
jgi:hypothetical protein